MQHYLSIVKTQKQREALTSLLLSTHRWLLKFWRYVDHDYQPVPRADRLCRLCKDEIETPEHALISCTSLDTLVELEAFFLVKLFENSLDLRTFMAETRVQSS
jgi:hypothetical protein